MNPALRLWLELSQLKCVLPAREYRRYLMHFVWNLGAIVYNRTLVPADHKMRGTVRFDFEHTSIYVPLDEIEQSLLGHDETPTFGGLREMYASNVYLRGFRSGLKASNVLDLGSNRGLFLMLSAKVLKAKNAIGVEPQTYYEQGFEALKTVNAPLDCQFTRINNMVRSSQSGTGVSIGALIEQAGIDRFHFVKCDIEGGEFNILIEDCSKLPLIDNLAMELHPEEGSVADLAGILRDSGFALCITDQFDNNTTPQYGHYLYASRTGDLLGAA